MVQPRPFHPFSGSRQRFALCYAASGRLWPVPGWAEKLPSMGQQDSGSSGIRPDSGRWRFYRSSGPWLCYGCWLCYCRSYAGRKVQQTWFPRCWPLHLWSDLWRRPDGGRFLRGCFSGRYPWLGQTDLLIWWQQNYYRRQHWYCLHWGCWSPLQGLWLAGSARRKQRGCWRYAGSYRRS